MQDMPRYSTGDYVRAIAPPIFPHGGGCASNALHDQNRHKVVKVEFDERDGTWNIKLAGKKQLWPANCFKLAEPRSKEFKDRKIRVVTNGRCKNCKSGPPHQLDHKTVKKLGLIPPQGADLKKVAYMFCSDCSAVSIVSFVRVVSITSTEVVIGKFPKVWDWAAGKK